MNPHQALIEAAEAIKACVFPLTPHEGQLIRNLDAAISSAKAAEEGVETDYYVEVQMPDEGWHLYAWLMKSHALCSHVNDPTMAQEIFSKMHVAPRRLMMRKRSESITVIEVREKEGL